MNKPLSNVDTAWLRMDHETNRTVITVVLVFEAAISFETILDRVEQRLVHHDRLRLRVTQSKSSHGAPVWEDDPHFDVCAHVHRVALPSPGDQRALEELVSDLMSTDIDRSRPLWQLHFVEGVDAGCAMVARLHHCIGDGVSLLPVMLSLMDGMEDLVPLPTSGEGRGGPPIPHFFRTAASAFNKSLRATELIVNEGREVLARPFHAVNLARQGAEAVSALGKLVLLPADSKTVLKGPLGTQKRAVWSEPIPLHDVKAVGRATLGTVNDVLLSVLAGALGGYLASRGENLSAINVRAVCPVNVRGPGPGGLGNQFGLVFIDLPVASVDPIARLNTVKARMDDAKESPGAVVALGVLGAVGMASAELEQLGLETFARKATIMMTNVPGPPEPVYLGGSLLRSVMVWSPFAGQIGLSATIVSYAGEVRVGIAADAGLVPDPEALVARYVGEFRVFYTRAMEKAWTATAVEAGDG